ncbi:hypothetical protein ATANTOWER_012838 [Ataeniobius toweri]|uniref:Uncharacterized protein n=1 Tax=Ataeniobius toweri TaxID=208326 RepID=A0ABU7BHA6_9TELE|nr:hypothetical protein [Ataeniobius toweri]
MQQKAALIKADFPHGLEKKAGTASQVQVARAAVPHRGHSTCLCRTVLQNEPTQPTAMEVSCKLTLCLPTRGCFLNAQDKFSSSRFTHTPSYRAHAETLSALQRTKPPLTSKTSRFLGLTPSRTKTPHSIISHHSLHQFISLLLANYLILCFSFLEGGADPVPESSCHNLISFLHK